MAVFSGGRWIRAGLLQTPPDFWPAAQQQQQQANDLTNEELDRDGEGGLKDRGLSFWHFPGNQDGEDIKALFKARLADAEELFTPDERVDIIEEAKSIFALCASLVDELDVLVGTSSPPLGSTSTSTSTSTPNSTQKDGKEEKVQVVPLEPDFATDLRVTPPTGKQADALRAFVRRPDVTGVLVAVGCLACVAVLKLQ